MPAPHHSENGTVDTMALRVKLEMQPDELLFFPPQCLNCGREPQGAIRLRKRRGRVTREIEAPLCDDCQRELRRLSGDEERWLRLGRFFGALAFVLSAALFLLGLPSWLPLWPRVLAALLLAAGAGLLTLHYFRRESHSKARPQKLAVQNAARLEDFSWRATTFLFENEEYGRQFVELNRHRLLETQKL